MCVCSFVGIGATANVPICIGNLQTLTLLVLFMQQCRPDSAHADFCGFLEIYFAFAPCHMWHIDMLADI